MTQPKCPRCLQLVAPEDTVVFDSGQAIHLDCRRPRDLSSEERGLLFRHCFDPAVAQCASCSQDFRQTELGSDLLSNRANLCPRCRVDLTERLREHLYDCTILPGEVRRTAREARAAARRFVQESQFSDADRLIREARSALAALREAMRKAASGS
jgi:hypothetical protein